MKIIFAALITVALSSRVMAYDRNQSMGEEWRQQRETAEMQRIEEAARQREAERNNQMQQIERQQKIEQRENEWRQRQLEVEQYRLWLWTR
jgi:3-hydroxyacyl-CoA dehydrogenase